MALYLSEPDVAKDSNTSCEILAHTLHDLAQQGVDLSACKVTLQAAPRTKSYALDADADWMEK